MPNVLKLLRNLVVLQPLRRRLSAGGIIYDPSRMDDKKQWRVINAGPAAPVKVGDHVLTQGMFEPLYDFRDDIVIAPASVIIAVIEGGL
jgi:hypothetical protein